MKCAENLTVKKRQGKCTHGLHIVRQLMADKENWNLIKSKHDYQFLGFYEKEQTQVVYYTPDAAKLYQSDNSNLHFLWDDIQLSKGKVNKDRQVMFEIGDEKVPLMYRCAPCNGVKICP